MCVYMFACSSRTDKRIYIKLGILMPLKRGKEFKKSQNFDSVAWNLSTIEKRAKTKVVCFNGEVR